jgi:hypothetical protein
LPILVLCAVNVICLLHGWCVAVRKTEVTTVHSNKEIKLHQQYCLANKRANIFTTHIQHSAKHLKYLHTVQFFYRLYYHEHNGRVLSKTIRRRLRRPKYINRNYTYG